MADNVTTQTAALATPPSATTIATDDVGGVHYQRMKLVDGTLDSTAAIPGSVANGLLVDVSRVTGSVAVTATSLPLPNGAALDATIVTMSAKLPATVGQKAMAASLPVVLASDQSALPVTGTFWPTTQPVSAAGLPLPAGAATEASLASIRSSLNDMAFRAILAGERSLFA